MCCVICLVFAFCGIFRENKYWCPLYEGVDQNPYKHLEKIADTEGDGDVKANFFESTVTSYNQSSAVEGWDDF